MIISEHNCKECDEVENCVLKDVISYLKDKEKSTLEMDRFKSMLIDSLELSIKIMMVKLENRSLITSDNLVEIVSIASVEGFRLGFACGRTFKEIPEGIIKEMEKG